MPVPGAARLQLGQCAICYTQGICYKYAYRHRACTGRVSIHGSPASIADVRAGIYLRISQDRTGEELGVERQREDCEALVTRREWTVERVYIDNDVSASGRKVRSGFKALLADIQAGRLQVVVAWSLDRLCRTARDRLSLVEACRDHNVLIALVRGSDMDLSTPAGRLTAGILGEVAQHEIDAKSDRQKRAQRQAAQQGRRIGGRRPFGYEQDGVTIRPNEAKAIATAYRDYLSGVPLYAVAKRWNKAGLLSGVTRADGTPTEWNHSGVRSVLRNPRYMGMRRHQPRGEEAALYPAAWPAIVDESTWRAAVALLDSVASEFKPRGGRRLLTGIATCAMCGERVHVGGNKRGAPPVYRCPTGKHMTRRAEPIEELVITALLAFLNRPDVVEQVASAGQTPQDEGLALEAARIRREMKTATHAWTQRLMTAEQFAIANSNFMAQLEQVERKLAMAGRPNVLRDLAGTHVTRERWDALGVDRQRVIISTLLEIRIHPVGRGVRYWRPETVEIGRKAPTPTG